MKNILSFFLVLIFFNCFAQEKLNTDSLLKIYSSSTNENQQIKLAIELSRQFKNKDNTKSKYYAKKAELLSAKLNENNSFVSAIILYANGLMNDGQLDSASYYLEKAEKNIEKVESNLNAELYINKGNLYDIKGDLTKSLAAFIQAEKISIENNLPKTLASSQIGIGNSYFQFHNFKKALEFFLKSKNGFEKLQNKTLMSYAVHNAASCYENLDSLDKAIEFYEISLKVKLDNNDNYGASYTYGNIGGIYYRLKKYVQAIEFIKKSLEFKLKVEGISNETLSESHQALADAYAKSNKLNEATHYADTALNLAIKSASLHSIVSATKIKAIILSKNHNYINAYTTLFNYTILSDSLNALSSGQAMAEMQTKYETEKKDTEISLLNKNKEFDQLELKKQRQIIIISIIGLILLLSFGLFSYSKYKLTQKQKQIINNQKNVVEQQKHLVEEKQKEILDSITYAKRLQQAILPPDSLINKHLPNCFVLYKPKDIVAGDFYWMETYTNLVMFAAADCTGHGVPGAMVSVVCSNALNRTVKEFGLTEPGKILDKVRDLVIETFEKSESEVKDGMDISLCVLDKQNKKLQWSGANNPLWLVRNNELIETKADKQPIGKYAEAKPFTTHQIQLEVGDSLYIFTDGYADQFGGEDGKKFKSSRMKELILSIKTQPIELQKEILMASFEAWKGNLEQIDDMCIIGVMI